MTRNEITGWLVERVARHLRTTSDAVRVHQPLEELGFGSMEIIAITGELETLLGRRVEPTMAWDYPTIDALARALAEGAEAPESTRIRVAAMPEEEVDALLKQLTGNDA